MKKKKPVVAAKKETVGERRLRSSATNKVGGKKKATSGDKKVKVTLRANESRSRRPISSPSKHTNKKNGDGSIIGATSSRSPISVFDFDSLIDFESLVTPLAVFDDHSDKHVDESSSDESSSDESTTGTERTGDMVPSRSSKSVFDIDSLLTTPLVVALDDNKSHSSSEESPRKGGNGAENIVLDDFGCAQIFDDTLCLSDCFTDFLFCRLQCAFPDMVNDVDEIIANDMYHLIFRGEVEDDDDAGEEEEGDDDDSECKLKQEEEAEDNHHEEGGVETLWRPCREKQREVLVHHGEAGVETLLKPCRDKQREGGVDEQEENEERGGGVVVAVDGQNDSKAKKVKVGLGRWTVISQLENVSYSPAAGFALRKNGWLPELSEDDVLIRVDAITMSTRNCLERLRRDPNEELEDDVPGYEIVGRVVRAGKSAGFMFSLGERIAAYLPYGGGCSQYVCINAKDAIALPSKSSRNRKVALLSTYMTAYQNLESIAVVEPEEDDVESKEEEDVGSKGEEDITPEEEEVVERKGKEDIDMELKEEDEEELMEEREENDEPKEEDEDEPEEEEDVAPNGEEDIEIDLIEEEENDDSKEEEQDEPKEEEDVEPNGEDGIKIDLIEEEDEPKEEEEDEPKKEENVEPNGGEGIKIEQDIEPKKEEGDIEPKKKEVVGPKKEEEIEPKKEENVEPKGEDDVENEEEDSQPKKEEDVHSKGEEKIVIEVMEPKGEEEIEIEVKKRRMMIGLSDDEVLIRVDATTISTRDCLERLRRDTNEELENDVWVPGHEIVGHVVRAGVNAEFLLNDRIAALLPYGGGCSQYVCINAKDAIALPEEAGSNELVALLSTYMTAYQCLESVVGIEPQEIPLIAGDTGQKRSPLFGKNVLIVGAGSPVGLALVDLARNAGATVCTLSHSVHWSAIRQMGAKHIQSLSQKKLWKERWAGKMDLIVDTIGDSDYNPSFYKVMKTCGRLVRVNVTSCEKKYVPLTGTQGNQMFRLLKGYKERVINDKAIEYDIFHSFNDDKELFTEDLAYLHGLLQIGKIRPKIFSRVAFDELEDEWEKVMEGETNGGVVVVSPWKSRV
jgi:NADPH:quinone reductase-like Zn-dependent oxidoreductase